MGSEAGSWVQWVMGWDFEGSFLSGRHMSVQYLKTSKVSLEPRCS